MENRGIGKIRLTWSLMFTLLLTICFSTLVSAKDLTKLIIMHTNDTHGFDQRAEGINGMPTVSALKQDFLAKGYTVLLLDAGDAIQDNNLVNISKGKSAIRFMNAAGYDAMALGNHEFDYGQEELLKRVKEAKFPMLAANVFVDATGKNLVESRAIIEKVGYKIGVFGLTTPGTVTSTNPKNVKGLSFLAGQDLYKEAQKQVDYLRAAKCDVVIALGHLGSEGHNTSDDVLNNVKGIDVFIDGHDHVVKNKVINGTPLVETGSHTENIGVLEYKNNKWQEDLYVYGRFVKEDPKVKKEVERELRAINKYLGQVFGQSEVALNGNRYPGVRTEETNLGDFMADAYLWQGQKASVLKETVHATLVNGGSIRNSIAKGKVTRGDLQGVCPYANQLYVVHITGSELLEILEAATTFTPEPMGAFPQLAGIKCVVDTKKAYINGPKYAGSPYYAPAKPGTRVTITEVAGQPFNPEATYNLVVTDFVAQGGDAYGALLGHGDDKRYSIGYTDIQAMENYLREGLNSIVDTSYAAPKGRVVIK